MGLKVACQALKEGTDCPYVVNGENMEELHADLAKHLKEAHGYTNKQLQEFHNPEMMKKLEALAERK